MLESKLLDWFDSDARAFSPSPSFLFLLLSPVLGTENKKLSASKILQTIFLKINRIKTHARTYSCITLVGSIKNQYFDSLLSPRILEFRTLAESRQLDPFISTLTPCIKPFPHCQKQTKKKKQTNILPSLTQFRLWPVTAFSAGRA